MNPLTNNAYLHSYSSGRAEHHGMPIVQAVVRDAPVECAIQKTYKNNDRQQSALSTTSITRTSKTLVVQTVYSEMVAPARTIPEASPSTAHTSGILTRTTTRWHRWAPGTTATTQHRWCSWARFSPRDQPPETHTQPPPARYHEDDANAVPLQVGLVVVKHMTNYCSEGGGGTHEYHCDGEAATGHHARVPGVSKRLVQQHAPSWIDSGTAMTTQMPAMNHTTMWRSALSLASCQMIMGSVTVTWVGRPNTPTIFRVLVGSVGGGRDRCTVGKLVGGLHVPQSI